MKNILATAQTAQYTATLLILIKKHTAIDGFHKSLILRGLTDVQWQYSISARGITHQFSQQSALQRELLQTVRNCLG